jgi:hypothetical protein
MNGSSSLTWTPKAPKPSAFRRAGQVARWSLRAPADRLTIPAAAVVYGAGAVLHATGVPALDVALTGGAALPALAFGVVNHRSHKHLKAHPDTDPLARASKAAFGMMMAGAWAATAARWGVFAGPWDLSTVAYFTATAVGYGALRYDEVVQGKRDWRNEKIRWHQVSMKFGLQGSHLLHSERTRLGRELTIDTTGTGKRASHIAGHDTAERIAEHYRIPASRVHIRPHGIAGRIRISIRERDPWAEPIPHPALDTEPEITLPECQSITQPLILGMDPETGKPLTLDAYDPEDFGARAIMIISTRGGGKTVLLNDLMERLTACTDVLVWDINLSKAKENRRWAPACDLVAHGPDAKRDALTILRLARKAIEYRGNIDGDDAIHQPSSRAPAIVVRVDEMKALLGGQSPIDQAIREQMTKLNETGRSEGVVAIIAGQRAVTTHAGSADIRANVDTVLLAKTRGRAEMMHAAGDAGMELPDMTSYGEGHAGVWLITTLGGEYQTGRTFLLKHLTDIGRIAESRRPQATLEPGLREHLGDAYERLKSGKATAHTVAEPAPQPWMQDLAKELEGVTTDVFDQMDELARKNAETRRLQEELASEELIELPPEYDEALRAAITERERQAAATVEIPVEHRAAVLAMTKDGARLRDMMTRLGLRKTTMYGYLARLRVEGLVEMRGKGPSAMWYSTGERAE